VGFSTFPGAVVVQRQLALVVRTITGQLFAANKTRWIQRQITCKLR